MFYNRSAYLRRQTLSTQSADYANAAYEAALEKGHAPQRETTNGTTPEGSAEGHNEGSGTRHLVHVTCTPLEWAAVLQLAGRKAAAQILRDELHFKVPSAGCWPLTTDHR